MEDFYTIFQLMNFFNANHFTIIVSLSILKNPLKKYGYKNLRLHDLRHSCASAMLSNGYALKDVQEWLGHTNIDTTEDTYGHLDISRKREIAKSFTEIFE